MEKKDRISAFLLILVSMSFFGCFKEKEYTFSTEILGLTDLSHDEVTIGVNFNSEDNIQYYEGGIQWGETIPFTEYDNNQFDYNVQTEKKEFKLENLHGNTTYYVQSYFRTDGQGDDGIVYSDYFNFTTPQSPEADCPTVAGEMKLDAFATTVWQMETAEISNNEYYVSIKSYFDLGNIEFRFKELPLSGVYSNNSSFTSLQDFEVSIFAKVSESWSCTYQTAEYLTVNVVNDGAGKIEISFCDVAMVTNGGCSPQHVFTGKISTM